MIIIKLLANNITSSVYFNNSSDSFKILLGFHLCDKSNYMLKQLISQIIPEVR